VKLTALGAFLLGIFGLVEYVVIANWTFRYLPWPCGAAMLFVAASFALLTGIAFAALLIDWLVSK
jgi:hypothetical protein